MQSAKRPLENSEFPLSKKLIHSIVEEIDAWRQKQADPRAYAHALTLPREMVPLLKDVHNRTIYAPKPADIKYWAEKHRIWESLKDLNLTPEQLLDYAYHHYNFLAHGAAEINGRPPNTQDYLTALKPHNLSIVVMQKAIFDVKQLESRQITSHEFWERQRALLTPAQYTAVLAALTARRTA
jgi:hypothetical protein